MRNHKVSTIVTTMNEEACIENCLKSLKNQSYKNMEIVVSDAKSKDKTVKIAKKYADRIIVRKTNVAEGRNLGAEMSKGDILFFVDADTVLMPDTVEKVVKAFDRKRVVGATCSALPQTAEARYVWVYMFYNNFAKASIRVKKPQIAGFFCAYRKDAFDKVGGFDGDIGVLEDYHLSQRIAVHGSIKFVEDALVLTSHRRLKQWGMRMPEKYMRAWLKLATTGRSFSNDWYKPVR